MKEGENDESLTREPATGGLPRRKRRRFIDQPLYVQFLAAGAIVGVASVVSLFLILNQLNRQTEASRWLAQTHRVIGRLNTMGRDFYRQQTALRRYVASAAPADLASVRERRAFWAEDIRRVRELVGDDRRERELLSAIEETYASWTELSDSIIDAVSRLGPNGVTTDALKEEALRFKEGFLLIDRLIDRENRLLTVRDKEEKSAVQATFSLVAAINIILLLIFSVVLAKLYFSIARPIAELSAGIEAYRGGDFGARVTVSNRSQIGYLEASFNDMAEKIEAMVDDLRKLDELKTDFLSTVSHELRTPLTSIAGYVKLLLSEDAGEVTPTQKEFLSIVDTNVARLTNLINDILDVEKIESGKIQLVREPQDLTGILKECRDTFDILARQKGLELRYEVPDEPMHVIGDRSRLVQVFMNLLSNAIKYTERGSVTLAAEAKEYAIHVHVTDTGVGLSSEDQEKLFQKFYRTRSALTSDESGTGLGLVIVRGLVEAHGGSINVRSAPGEGTTFTVTLPVEDLVSVLVESESKETAASGRDSAEAPAPPRPAAQIWLLVRRSADIEKIESMIAEAAGGADLPDLNLHAFATFDQMAESLRKSSAPALVIIDTDATRGVNAADEARKVLGGGVPVLYFGSQIDPIKAFAQGAGAVLSKPVKKERFIATVHNLIASKGWKILIADGNTDFRLLVKRALEQRGFKVDDLDRGNLALSRLMQEEYDLVLLDVNLPDISGEELLNALREKRGFGTMPVLLMSDEAGGADTVVTKSMGIDHVVDAICRHAEQVHMTEGAK